MLSAGYRLSMTWVAIWGPVKIIMGGGMNNSRGLTGDETAGTMKNIRENDGKRSGKEKKGSRMNKYSTE